MSVYLTNQHHSRPRIFLALFPDLSCTNQKPLKLETPFAIPPLSNAAADITGAIIRTTIAVIGSGSVTALTTVLSFTGLERRGQIQEEEVSSGEGILQQQWISEVEENLWRY